MVNNDRGMTLVEVLVVIIILGILSLVVVVGFSTVIQQARDKAFVANASMLKDAARNYYSSMNIEVTTDVTYDTLKKTGFVEPFKDPYTNTMMPDGGYNSFVRIERTENRTNYYVCYVGETKMICSEDDEPILVENIDVNTIRDR